jgi:hypothetical protein
MPDVELAPGDAAELAELLTFLADWIRPTSFLGSPGYDLTTLHADLQRFAFLLGASDGEDLFGHHH